MNKSLSARIRRRNQCGFVGEGTNHQVFDETKMGDYRDPLQNGKKLDYLRAERKKSILGCDWKRMMCKKYANNKQRW